jgi:hypothetical protein
MSALNTFDLEGWLDARATSKESIGEEIVFTHKDNSTSILLPKVGQASEDQALSNSPLSWFYDEFKGASIGNSHVMLASSQKGGVVISQGFRLPDREMMIDTLKKLGFENNADETFFAVEAAWMFAYAIKIADGVASLVRYDRDMKTFESVESLKTVLEDWWNLVCEDE